MSACCYWWFRYGHFSPGMYNLPHMGEVIAHYRRKQYDTQAKFAIASGSTERAVHEWESCMYTADIERRIFLARMLKIPPALLALDWHNVFDGEHSSPDHMADLIVEDSFYHYEDTLVMAWEITWNGRRAEIDDRMQRRFNKLIKIVEQAPETEKEAWKGLLGRYYHFMAVIDLARGADAEHKKQALQANASALRLAKDVDDVEQLALSFIFRADIYQDLECYTRAKGWMNAAMEYVERVRAPLMGNIYLRSASVYTPYVVGDEKLATQIRKWQDRTLNLVHKGRIEYDSTFLKLNRAAVHHERAKTLLQFHELKYKDAKLPPTDTKLLRDARNEMNLAWKAFTPDLTEWSVYFHLTEARLFAAEHDLEGSAKSGKAALKAAREMESQRKDDQVRTLYFDLRARDARNPYVHNLGLELGIFA